MGKKKKAKVLANAAPEANQFHVEVYRDGRWQTVATFANSPHALKGLVKARDAAPQARYRVTDDTAKVHLDLPAVGS
jgi:hypothetical protein